jgi:hypothetical protein
MRAAAVFSAALIAAGLYLAMTAALSISTSWTALGSLVIALVAALGVMATGRPSARSPRSAA